MTTKIFGDLLSLLRISENDPVFLGHHHPTGRIRLLNYLEIAGVFPWLFPGADAIAEDPLPAEAPPIEPLPIEPPPSLLPPVFRPRLDAPELIVCLIVLLMMLFPFCFQTV